MKEEIREAANALKALSKYLFISGDATLGILTVTGELPRYAITTINKSIETLKYTLNNNPDVNGPLYSIVGKYAGDIVLATWLLLSAIWTGYKIFKD